MDARSQQGLWLLRIDDFDTPRNIFGAADAIFETLETFGLHWDGPVAYQSQQKAFYQQTLQQLHAQNLLYACTCSRKSLSEHSPTANAENIYPNICRDLHHPQTGEYALRIKTEPNSITFDDGIQGTLTENLATQHGDFILQRKDHIIAYQFAVVLDDQLQGVNHVVRGADLLDSTFRQIYLHQCLGLIVPNYLHVPVLTGANGTKLSKREFSPAVNEQNNRQILYKLLKLLAQNPPPELSFEPVTIQLAWAIEHWHPKALSHIRSIDITNT